MFYLKEFITGIFGGTKQLSGAKVSLEYEEIIQKCIKKNINRPIKNSNNEHAKCLIYYLIKRTKDNGEIRIFSGNMNEAIYKEDYIKDALKEAMDRGIKIRIIVETNLNPGEMEIINYLSKLDETKIEIFKLKEKIIKTFKHENISFVHFLVSDCTAFRIEKPHDDDEFENNKINANANFNNVDFAERICNLFDDSLYQKSNLIPIQ